MDKQIMIWDLLANKHQMSINTKKYAEMNHISLSENQSYYRLKGLLKDNKKSIKKFVLFAIFTGRSARTPRIH